MGLEVEVKFLVDDLKGFRDRLLAAGATLKKPRVYERNIRFDTQAERLRQNEMLLRLRQDQSARLTFKGRAEEDSSSEAKVREELEITVSDFYTTATILERIGFHPVQVYEKYRETFHINTVEVVLDEMSFGNFVELEGEEVDIKATASTLHLDWSQRILDNYLLLMGKVKQHYNLPFNDLTFANFESLAISIGDVLG